MRLIFSYKIKLIFIQFIIVTICISSINSKLLHQNIAIAYGFDNNYRYPTLVSITSIIENASESTFYTFYLLIEKTGLLEETKKIFYNLENKYNNVKIVLLEMEESMFGKARIDRYPMPTYYRLILAKLLPKVNRVIYLDGDTLILNDLTEMINIEMENNVMMGFVDNSWKKAEEFGVKTYKYVTAGVLLINLKKIRTENITKKFFDFMEHNTKKLTQEDQTIINIVLHGRIGLLPPKFGIWNFRDESSAGNHNCYCDKSLGVKAYDEKVLFEALKRPTIVHFDYGKPWNERESYANLEFYQKWWEYTEKTDEYSNIVEFYGGDKRLF